MKTFKEIRTFNILAGAFLKKDKNADTKLGYAIKRISEKEIDKITKEFRASQKELWDKIVGESYLNNALTDKTTGAVLLAPKDSTRPYQFDKKGMAEVIKAEKDFDMKIEKHLAEWDKKEFEIAGFKTTEVPELTDDEKEAFIGFVI